MRFVDPVELEKPPTRPLAAGVVGFGVLRFMLDAEKAERKVQARDVATLYSTLSSTGADQSAFDPSLVANRPRTWARVVLHLLHKRELVTSERVPYFEGSTSKGLCVVWRTTEFGRLALEEYENLAK